MADPKIRIRASDETGPAFRSAERNLDGLSGAAARLLGALGGTVAVGALFNLAKGAIDAADELSKLSQRTGIAIETLGGLGFAADMAGGSMDSIADAADKLNKSLAEAASGQKLAKEAFDALGISATDAAGQTKSVDVAMAEIADKFASFADGPEKAALAMRLFGKAGADQIVLLNAGGAALRDQIEYYKRYSGVSEETSRRAEVFNDTLSKIGLLSTSLGNTLAASLLPSLQAVADAMLDLKENGTGFSGIGSALRIVFETLAISTANLAFAFKAVGLAYGGALAILRSPFSFTTISDAVRADTQRAINELKAFERKVYGIGSSSANDESEAERRRLGLSGPATAKRPAPRLPTVSTGSRGGGAPKADPITDAERALARYVDQLSKTIEKTQDLSEQEKALNFLREIGTTGQIPQVRELVLGLAKQIDTEKALSAATEERIRIGREAAIAAGERVAEANREYQDRLKSLTEGAASNVFKRQQEDLQFLQQALEKGAISVQVYGESVKNLFNITDESAVKSKSLVEELGLSFTSAFEDAIVGGKGLSDVLKGLEQDILRIVTRKLVTEPLGGAITDIFKGGSSSGGGIGGALSSVFSSIFGGFRATGGAVRAGMAYMVGEDGPELFTPRSGGQIIPNNVLAGAGSGGRAVNVTINQSFAPGTSRATTLQAAADASRQLQLAGRNL